MKVGNFEVDANDLFNKVIWLAIVGILSFSAKKFNDMSNDISSLNQKMVGVILSQTQYQKGLEDHETRIRVLEHNPTHYPTGN